jgi:ceramide glucosyltransferase
VRAHRLSCRFRNLTGHAAEGGLDVDVLRYTLTLFVWLGIAQGVAGLLAVIAFAARKPPRLTGLPPVTILKPICGDEPLLEEAITSFCRQNYPDVQLVIGAQDAADPALAAARRVAHWHPEADVQIVVDPARQGVNGKIANLINMLPYAKHDVLVIADSDLHVTPDYLEKIVAELQLPGTGLVTTLPAAEPAAAGPAATIGSSHLTHGFLPSALIGAALGRQDCLGGTMALYRDDLERIGGLEALVDQLADDNLLGEKIRELGLAVRIAKTLPVVTVQEKTFHDLWQHELRWARTIGSVAPLSLAGCVLQYPIFWALLALPIFSKPLWGLALLATACAARALIQRGIDAALAPHRARPVHPTPLWQLPVRDVLSVAEIVASFFGRQVVWRGRTLYAGRIAPARPLVPIAGIAPVLQDSFAGETESIVIG